MTVDEDLDRLYKLPLTQFVEARNDLAASLKKSGDSAASKRVRELKKPSASAWAVNQLYWQERPVYDRLVKASERLRGEHRKMLAGKSADIRNAEHHHREALRDAVDRIRAILQSADQTLSPATLAAVQETLEALPSDSLRPPAPRATASSSAPDRHPLLAVDGTRTTAWVSGNDSLPSLTRTATV